MAPQSSAFDYVAGRGVRATVDGRRLAAGGPNMISNSGNDEAIRRATEAAEARGQAIIYLAEGQRVLAAFTVADALRPEAKQAVERPQFLRRTAL